MSVRLHGSLTPEEELAPSAPSYGEICRQAGPSTWAVVQPGSCELPASATDGWALTAKEAQGRMLDYKDRIRKMSDIIISKLLTDK